MSYWKTPEGRERINTALTAAVAQEATRSTSPAVRETLRDLSADLLMGECTFKVTIPEEANDGLLALASKHGVNRAEIAARILTLFGLTEAEGGGDV